MDRPALIIHPLADVCDAWTDEKHICCSCSKYLVWLLSSLGVYSVHETLSGLHHFHLAADGFQSPGWKFSWWISLTARVKRANNRRFTLKKNLQLAHKLLLRYVKYYGLSSLKLQSWNPKQFALLAEYIATLWELWIIMAQKFFWNCWYFHITFGHSNN